MYITYEEAFVIPRMHYRAKHQTSETRVRYQHKGASQKVHFDNPCCIAEQ